MTFYSIISSNQKRFGKLEKHVDELIYVGTLQQKLECIIQVIQDTVECIALLLNGTVELKNSDGSIYFKQLIYDPVEYAIWFREFGSKVPFRRINIINGSLGIVAVLLFNRHSSRLIPRMSSLYTIVRQKY